MSRVILLSFFLLPSMITQGQDTTFDNKVQQLFFNINVEKPSPSLITKFKKVPALTYKKPRTVTTSLNGKLSTHIFTFRNLSFLTNPFDAGSIELEVVQYKKEKRLHDIIWRLRFSKKQDAVNVFDELKTFFADTQAIQKVYSSDLALQTAEITDTNSKKYPYIMFMLFDKNEVENNYQILFSLDNETHYAK